MYIEELKRPLTGRLLEIWTGEYKTTTPLPEWKRQQMIALIKGGQVRQMRQPPKSGGCGCGGKRKA